MTPIIIATVLSFTSATVVVASINADLRPNIDGGVGLYLVGNGTDLVASIEIIVEYDPAQMTLTGATNDPDAPLMDFFDPLPDFVGCNRLKQGGIGDGDAMYIGLVTPGVGFAPSPEGTRVATFYFTGSGPVNIPATLACGVTVIWSGESPSTPVTGTLTGTNTADYDNDGTVGINDLLVVLANWDDLGIVAYLAVLTEWGWTQ